jgi:hypothetical protein
MNKNSIINKIVKKSQYFQVFKNLTINTIILNQTKQIKNNPIYKIY